MALIDFPNLVLFMVEVPWHGSASSRTDFIDNLIPPEKVSGQLVAVALFNYGSNYTTRCRSIVSIVFKKLKCYGLFLTAFSHSNSFIS